MAQNLANPNIKHVFVLMLENRSFDHMLGFSGITGTDAATGQPTAINGATAANTNGYGGKTYAAGMPAADIMPFDPGHEFCDVLEQLCGAGTACNGSPYPAITNAGFVSNYATSKSAGVGGTNPDYSQVMKCYDSVNQLPVMTTLAKEFAVCDHWHASLPGPTWPNRFFVHAASSGGLDHSPRTTETLDWETLNGFSFKNGTIFNLMDRHKLGYRLYRGVGSPTVGAIPCVAALKGINIWDTHAYKKFQSDLGKNYPWSYTFIEPNYGDIIHNTYAGGQSQHPMDDVRNGEALIKSTYEAIRNSPLWESSLLIITYDEHGGFYDHVAPPAAVAPGDTEPHSQYNEFGFDFTTYGIRVPAIVVSAYTAKNTISHQLYDHASVPATLEAMFNMPPLTKRDAAANNVTSLAALKTARTDTPATLPAPAAIEAVQVAAMRGLQPPPKKDSDPVDGGNLPGFLHVVRKSQLNKAPAPTRGLIREKMATDIRNRGQAKNYLETALPGLLDDGL